MHILQKDDKYLENLLLSIEDHKIQIEEMRSQITLHEKAVDYLRHKIRYSQKIIKELVKITKGE